MPYTLHTTAKPPKDSWIPFLAAFEMEVDLKSKKIDPEDMEDWNSLTLGWAIGKGMKIKEAKDFALYVRYSTSMG